MPEVIPAEELAVAYERLKPEGIDMKWHIVDHGAYPEYKKLPAGMTQQAAFHKFIEALGYMHPGTWTFEWQFASDPTTPPSFSTSSFGGATPIPYPTATANVVATLDGRIRSFDLSPDSKTIALATSKGLVVYGMDDKERRALTGAENFYSVDWSPDGGKLAGGSILMKTADGGTPHLTVWDTGTWKVIFESELSVDSFASFGALAWSPDGNFLAVSDFNGGLVVLDIKTRDVISRQKDFLVAPYDISWSPDGSRLVATGDLGFGFRRWRLSTDESVRLYDPRAGTAALQLAWSGDGKRIVSAHAGGMICFWTAETNQCDGFIRAHKNSAFSLALSPDESRLATGGGVINVWDLSNGRLLNSFGLNKTSIYSQLEWLPDGRLVSLEAGYADTSPTLVRFWDVETGSVLMEFQGASGSFGE